MRFEGKCVVVTGASSGMGRKIALDFAKEGATVIAVARRLERLEESMRQLTRNPDFKVLPSAYASKAVNGTKNVYALYNKSEDTLRMNIPVDYTNTMANTTNGFQFENVAYGQFTGITLIRPKEMIYFTNTADY